MGVAGRVRPRRLAEEAQLTPHGKRASWNGNQHAFLTDLKEKNGLLLNVVILNIKTELKT